MGWHEPSLFITPITDPKYGYVKNPLTDSKGGKNVEYMVKFDRSDLDDTLEVGSNKLVLTGETSNFRFVWNGSIIAKE
jgi:hypothetical protein